MTLNGTDYLNELKFSIQKQDSIKLGVLINHFDDLDLQFQRRAIFELSRADDNFSLPFLVKLATSNLCLPEEIPELKQVLLSKCVGKYDELHSLLVDNMITYEQFLNEITSELSGGDT
jgi:hypothetical protein